MIKLIHYQHHINLGKKILISCAKCGEYRIKRRSVVVTEINYCSNRCSKLGRKASDATRLKISNNNKNRSPEIKLKISRSKLGIPNSAECRRKIGIASKKSWQDPIYRQNFINKMKGHTTSPETRKKISESHIGDKHWTNHMPYPEEAKVKLRAKRLHQVFPVKDTKIEKMVRLALDLNNIKYRRHEPVIGQPDFYIVSRNTEFAIFCDGCFWHGCTQCHGVKILSMNIPQKNIEQDQRVDGVLKSKGIHVIRLWEHEITADSNCYKLIKTLSENSITDSWKGELGND